MFPATLDALCCLVSVFRRHSHMHWSHSLPRHSVPFSLSVCCSVLCFAFVDNNQLIYHGPPASMGIAFSGMLYFDIFVMFSWLIKVIRSFVRSFVRSLARSLVRSLIHSRIHSFIHSFIHSVSILTAIFQVNLG